MEQFLSPIRQMTLHTVPQREELMSEQIFELFLSIASFALEAYGTSGV